MRFSVEQLSDSRYKGGLSCEIFLVMLTERAAIDSDRIEVDHIEGGRIDGDRPCVLFWVTHGEI